MVYSCNCTVINTYQVIRTCVQKIAQSVEQRTENSCIAFSIQARTGNLSVHLLSDVNYLSASLSLTAPADISLDNTLAFVSASSSSYLRYFQVLPVLASLIASK
jgi:hypothetical protein